MAVGHTAAGLPAQIAALDEAVESLRRDQPMWHVDMGRAVTTRTVQIRLQARGVDEALQIVKLEVDRLLKLSSPGPTAGTPVGETATGATLEHQPATPSRLSIRESWVSRSASAASLHWSFASPDRPSLSSASA